MANEWTPVRIDAKLYQNLPEVALTRASAVMENIFINEGGGHSRFPGLTEVARNPDGGVNYLTEWRGDLMSGTSRGRLHRIRPNGAIEDVTGVPIGGGRRIIFDKSEDELMMAAGGPILRYAGATTEVLSPTAPLSTHIQFVDGYGIAAEVDSNRFYHSRAGLWREWDPLDTFTAEAKPDNISALLVTPFREVLCAGTESIEQFERLPDGDRPFFRRWAIGEGLHRDAAYTMVVADNGSWCVNKDLEFVRFSGQTSTPASDDVQYRLEGIDDWRGSWAAKVHVVGQKFMLLQMPSATNAYGTKGITYAYDYRARRWLELYGWDEAEGLPACWPGRSVQTIGGTTYVGGEGVIWKLDPNSFRYGDQLQRLFFRSGHYASEGRMRIDGLRMQVSCGTAAQNAEPAKLRLRMRRDQEHWTRWVEKTLRPAGRSGAFIDFGNFGISESHQIEYELIGEVPFSFVKLEKKFTRIFG